MCDGFNCSNWAIEIPARAAIAASPSPARTVIVSSSDSSSLEASELLATGAALLDETTVVSPL